MNIMANINDPEGPSILPSVILNFCVQRFSEFLQSDHPKAPLVIQGLALAGLCAYDELSNEYKDILSSPYYSPVELVHRAIRIFELALKRDPDSWVPQHPSGDSKDDRVLDERSCRQVMRTTLREARQMLKENDIRWVSIIECCGWISLQGDSERLADFEEMQRRFAGDPKRLLEESCQILRDALFRRRRP